MPKHSAGLLMYRKRAGVLEVFLVHPGGPFFAKKDKEVWGIPKGEIDEGEDTLAAARREFEEETGFKAGGFSSAHAGDSEAARSCRPGPWRETATRRR